MYKNKLNWREDINNKVLKINISFLTYLHIYSKYTIHYTFLDGTPKIVLKCSMQYIVKLKQYTLYSTQYTVPC